MIKNLFLKGLFLFMSIFSLQSQNSLKVGDMLPNFELQDQNGDLFQSADFIGKQALVIYFYPKDDTPGCTKEACAFRDAYADFTDRQVKVIGISSDSVESHKNFTKKYNLPFTLLADTKKEVRTLFGVPNAGFGLIPGRVTYVTDSTGHVIYIYDSMTNAENHIKEALKALQ